MINQQQLCKVLNDYIDKELAPLSNGTSQVQQLLFGFQLGILKRKSQTVVKEYLASPAAKMLHLVEGENVDIDTIYGALSEALTKQGSIELLGIKFTPADVNKLYAMIKEQNIYETNYTPNT